MLLSPRKASEALYLEQTISPTCFQRCQDVVVRLKLFCFNFFSFFKGIRLKFRTACQDRQAKKCGVNCLFKDTKERGKTEAGLIIIRPSKHSFSLPKTR